MDVRQARERGLRGVSLGILGMEERVSLLGGRLEITSAVGHGTEVALRIPIAGGQGSERRLSEDV